MGKIDVTLISGRTAQQGAGLEVGKKSDEYFRSASFIELGEVDADALGIGDDHQVKVSTSHGTVVVTAKRSKNLDKGIAFFPYGPWANKVFGSETGGTGMPCFKGIKASLEKSEQKTPTLTELVEEMKRG